MIIGSLNRLRKVDEGDLRQMSREELIFSARLARKRANEYVKRIEDEGLIFAIAEMGRNVGERMKQINKNETNDELIMDILKAQAIVKSEFVKVPRAREVQKQWEEMLKGTDLTYDDVFDALKSGTGWIDRAMKLSFESGEAYNLLQDVGYDKDKFIQLLRDELVKRKEEEEELGIR